MNDFKPLLAPNEEVDLNTLTYPLLASTKIDGIRMIVKDRKLFSRSLKPIMSDTIKTRFAFLSDFSNQYDRLLDGELYSPGISFSELSGQCRAYNREIEEDLSFYCFDILNTKIEEQKEYIDRLRELRYYYEILKDTSFVKLVSTRIVNNKEDIERYFEDSLKEGYEGLILRNPKGKYKYGRATVKENIIYKLKPFRTFDAKVIGILQATEVREEAEKKINELGRSVTSKKKEDRVLINKASAFVVLYENKELKVTIAMTDEEKTYVWNNPKKYIGKTIEYKGMLVGAKDLPRHPVFIRMREDKD